MTPKAGAPLRYIAVGAGGFGAYWCTSVLPRLERLGKARAVAVVDVDPATHELAQRELGLAPERCYVDGPRAFAENEADFVVIVVPPAHHEQYVDLAVDHGLDVLSEKPIADTMAASVRIARKIEAAGRKMMVTMSHRYADDKQTLSRLVRGGDFGPLSYVVGRFTMNLRAFGSWGRFRHEMLDPLVIEGAVHHFDVLRELAGADAATITGLTWNPPWGEYAGDSTGLFLIEMTNGVRCLYEGAKANAAMLNGWGHEYFRAECEKATLELDNREVRVLRSDGWAPPTAERVELLDQPAWMNEWLAEQFCDWLNGGPAPVTTVTDNLQCVAMVFAAVEASRTGRTVDVQQFLAEHMSA